MLITYIIMVVDFEEVNKNIKKDSLDIALIRVIYKDLTSLEAEEILKYQGGERLGEGEVLSFYPEDLDPLYQEKAECVLYLGAD